MRRSNILMALIVGVASVGGYTGARLFSKPTSTKPFSLYELLSPTPEPSRTSGKGEAQIPLQPANPSQVVWIGNSQAQAAEAMSLSASLPTGKALLALATRWLGRPYTEFSLDQSKAEQLRIDLTSFDCFLFVEQLIALVNSRTTGSLTDYVRQLRYKGGIVDYCERHHYFTRWAEAAQEQGIIADLTPSLPGGTRRTRALTFMSSHPGSYKPMAQARNSACIASLERNLVVEQTFVPLAKLPAASQRLETGDIFGLVTGVDGLDVTHVGFIERGASGLKGIHAVPRRGVIRSNDFFRYVNSVPDVIGIAFYRPFPRPPAEILN